MTQTTKRQSLWRRIRLWQVRRRNAAAVSHLSDSMRRDIGMPRDPDERREIQSLHDAMRYSG